jgi:hypothetical protein
MPDFGRGRMLDGEMEPSSLAGRVALVTGAGRRVGIGAAVGARLRAVPG